ncbi:hypothetical protein B0H17DRAFT_1149205 [Mycena rosella]|uniref:Uncharacterized protein n=1 Tax=Mycena rosella TaxID=1033263 RepID=A0AAD7FUC9_MYCRO|nr:hypothetical protein B0H17DRAFT_1149205 [Mycena rosella]
MPTYAALVGIAGQGAELNIVNNETWRMSGLGLQSFSFRVVIRSNYTKMLQIPIEPDSYYPLPQFNDAHFRNPTLIHILPWPQIKRKRKRLEPSDSGLGKGKMHIAMIGTSVEPLYYYPEFELARLQNDEVMTKQVKRLRRHDSNQ